MPRSQRPYDHRLVRLVQDTGDITIATGVGVPRSTASGWLRQPLRKVTSVALSDAAADELRVRLARMEARLRRCQALLRVLLAVLRILQPDLTRLRVPQGSDKGRLLRALDRARGVARLPWVLELIGLSPSRLASWRRAALSCDLDDRSSCPRSSPHELTPAEVATIRDLVASPEHRHVPTGRLASLAQRLGRVFASPTTSCRLVRERGWRRPRLRVHPEGPKVGIRATKPNEVWHVDTTVIRLLDGRRTYLHALIDNFSRRILAWKVHDRFDPGSAVEVLVAAGRQPSEGAAAPRLLADAGIENRSRSIDELIGSGLFQRVLAMTEIRCSNSMIEAWWPVLKHSWHFLHPLDSVAKVRRLVAFYVGEHNTRIPHAASQGQTPDEVFFGTGEAVPEALAEARRSARRARLEANRARECAVCA